MIVQKTARIFRSETRGSEESTDYRCLSTFNYGACVNEHRQPFGPLTVLNDETLAPGKSKFYFLKGDTLVILMPLVGVLEFEVSNGRGEGMLIPEEMQLLSMKEGMSYYVTNPYKKDLINYLHLQLVTGGVSGKRSFENLENNRLNPILKSGPCSICFGVYDGRNEGSYRLKGSGNGIFAFVINGAFEVENRLLESRDGLALWGLEALELEALSENAIILLLEVSLKEKKHELQRSSRNAVNNNS